MIIGLNHVGTHCNYHTVLEANQAYIFWYYRQHYTVSTIYKGAVAIIQRITKLIGENRRFVVKVILHTLLDRIMEWGRIVFFGFVERKCVCRWLVSFVTKVCEKVCVADLDLKTNK